MKNLSGKKKRFWVLVCVAAAAAAMLLGGCGSKNKVKLDPDNPVTITIWHYYNGAQQTAFDSLVKALGSSSARIRCGIRPETEEDARRRDDPSLPAASCVPSDTFFLTPGKEYTLPLPDFTAWTPENPFLYHADLDLDEDHVECYFAMRKCDIQTDAAGLRRIFLNNAPYMQTGVLDQGYWPDGL